MLDNLLGSLDARCFLGFDVWEFSARSLFKPYGRLFLGSVVLRHPWRSIAGLWNYRRHVRPARRPGCASVGRFSREEFAAELAGSEWVLGLGFCQKVLDPPCPSGRFNHGCWLLAHPDVGELPAACRQCHIREVVLHALPAGAALYIMTSAADIARDLLLPGLRSHSAKRVVLCLCPFSVPPITLAMSICGLRGLVLSYGPGVCENFAAWALADEGAKPEQTRLAPQTHDGLLALLDRVGVLRRAKNLPLARTFRESGNLYVPVA